MKSPTWIANRQGWLPGFLVILLIVAGAGLAATQSDLLRPEEAFQPEVEAVGPTQVRVIWEVAEGYYLYRDKLTLEHARPRVLVPSAEAPPKNLWTAP